LRSRLGTAALVVLSAIGATGAGSEVVDGWAPGWHQIFDVEISRWFDEDLWMYLRLPVCLPIAAGRCIDIYECPVTAAY
jgi:hypothetical protein